MARGSSGAITCVEGLVCEGKLANARSTGRGRWPAVHIRHDCLILAGEGEIGVQGHSRKKRVHAQALDRKTLAYPSNEDVGQKAK